jgi:riboflavin kinase/FMN adenylyltransferase
VDVFRGIDEVPAGFGPAAVTIGKFDGLHLGHRAVIADLLAAAGEADGAGLVPTVVTFDRNPLALLHPEACPPPLVGESQKLELLAGAGVGATLVLRFDRALAGLEPEAFVRDVLVGPLRTRVLLVGDDFRFGRGGRGDIALLRALAPELGFTLAEHDIEADDDLFKRYLERIPVVVLDGEELFDFFVDEAVLRDRLGRVDRE